MKGYATTEAAWEESMKYSLEPCGERDAELIWERAFEDLPTGDAEQELIVLKAVGSALVKEAERIALDKGCRTAVNTYNFDFQHARGLFEKQGYILSAVVKDWPKGHECYVLTKKLGFVEDGSSAPEGEQFTILPGTEEEDDLITAKLEESVRAFAPRSHGYIDIDKKLLDEDGVTVGGCIAGVSGWDTLHIDAFRADETSGPYLLGEVEREAAAMGAYLACVSCAETRAQFFVEDF